MALAEGTGYTASVGSMTRSRPVDANIKKAERADLAPIDSIGLDGRGPRKRASTKEDLL